MRHGSAGDKMDGQRPYLQLLWLLAAQVSRTVSGWVHQHRCTCADAAGCEAGNKANFWLELPLHLSDGPKYPGIAGAVTGLCGGTAVKYKRKPAVVVGVLASRALKCSGSCSISPE